MGPGRPVKPMAPDGPFSAIWGRQAGMTIRQEDPDITPEVLLRLMMRHVRSFILLQVSALVFSILEKTSGICFVLNPESCFVTQCTTFYFIQQYI